MRWSLLVLAVSTARLALAELRTVPPAAPAATFLNGGVSEADLMTR
jgi:hypothetical protein